MLNRAEIPPIDPNLCWKVFPIKAGTSLDCWIAGKVFPAWVHWSEKRNQPCVFRLTDGKVKCRQCGARVGVKLVGYQPVYDRHGDKLVVVASHQTTAELDYLMTGAPVRLSRPGGDRQRINIGKQDDTPTLRALDRKYQNRVPADISPWLVLLWKDSRLKDHLRAAEMATDNDPEDLPVNVDIVQRAFGLGDMFKP